MTTALGLFLVALGLVALYGAWRNMRPDQLLLSLIDEGQDVGKID